jgi:hypothetical protein
MSARRRGGASGEGCRRPALLLLLLQQLPPADARGVCVCVHAVQRESDCVLIDPGFGR